jgi:hypothetical protein
VCCFWAAGGRGIGHGEAVPVDGITLAPSVSPCGYSGRSWRWRLWGPSVASPLPSAVASPPSLLLPVEPAPPATAEPRQRSQRPNGSSPPTTRKRVVLLPHTQIEPTNTRFTIAAPEGATGMNQDDERRVPRVQPADRRYRALHPVPPCDRGPSCSAHPMLHLLPYPRPRRQGRAVLRSHIGSGSVPGARGKQPKPRQITG